MNDDPSAWAVLAYRLVGAISGAFTALVFIQPRTMREFLRRAGATVVAGLILTHPLRLQLGWPSEPEYIMASAAIVAFTSWFAMGAVVGWVRAQKDDLSKP